jgi:hypothetical protein
MIVKPYLYNILTGDTPFRVEIFNPIAGQNISVYIDGSTSPYITFSNVPKGRSIQQIEATPPWADGWHYAEFKGSIGGYFRLDFLMARRPAGSPTLKLVDETGADLVGMMVELSNTFKAYYTASNVTAYYVKRTIPSGQKIFGEFFKDNGDGTIYFYLWDWDNITAPTTVTLKKTDRAYFEIRFNKTAMDTYIGDALKELHQDLGLLSTYYSGDVIPTFVKIFSISEISGIPARYYGFEEGVDTYNVIYEVRAGLIGLIVGGIIAMIIIHLIGTEIVQPIFGAIKAKAEAEKARVDAVRETDAEYSTIVKDILARTDIGADEKARLIDAVKGVKEEVLSTLKPVERETVTDWGKLALAGVGGFVLGSLIAKK